MDTSLVHWSTSANYHLQPGLVQQPLNWYPPQSIFHISVKVILKYKSDRNSSHPSEGFNGFPKQPYLFISSLTTLPCVRHTWPLFSSESMLNSSCLQVLALAVPSTWNALFLTPYKTKTVFSLPTKRISLTILRSLLFYSLAESAAWYFTSFFSICNLFSYLLSSPTIL